MYSKEFINKIKSCGVYNIAVRFTQLEKSGNVYIGKCPHPDHNDSNPSFRIFVDQNTGMESWVCMGCHCGKKDDKNNFGSDNIAFLRWMSCNKKSDNILTFVEAVKMLAKFYNIPEEEDKYSFLYKENMNKALKWNDDMLNKYHGPINYLSCRGLDKEDIKKWLIGYDGDRITFPIFDMNKNIIGFSNRMYGPISTQSKQKYKNSPSSEIFNKSNILYGLQHFNTSKKHILITEGQIDVILAHKYGIDYAVASMTSHLSEGHISLLKKLGKIPILCFDNDSAGNKGLISTVDILRKNHISPINFLPLPDAMDLADVAKYYNQNLQNYVVNKTKLYSYYEVSILLDRIDSRFTEILLENIPAIKNTILSIDDKNEQKMIKNFVSNRLRLWKEGAIL